MFLYGFPVLGLGLLLSGAISGQSAAYQKLSILVMVSIVATIHTLSISMFSDISIISLIMITLVAKLLVFPPSFSMLVYTIYILQANMMVEIFSLRYGVVFKLLLFFSSYVRLVELYLDK